MTTPEQSSENKPRGGWLRKAFGPMGLAVFGGILIGMVGVFASGGVLEATSTNEFCTSCHEMNDFVKPSYEASAHFSNASGVRADCADCHVPKEFLPKMIRKTASINEVYHKILGTISTREKFEAKRPELAQRVWDYMAENDSRECRSCHSVSAMDLHAQSPESAQLKAKFDSIDATCINCHKGVAHDLAK